MPRSLFSPVQRILTLPFQLHMLRLREDEVLQQERERQRVSLRCYLENPLFVRQSKRKILRIKRKCIIL